MALTMARVNIYAMELCFNVVLYTSLRTYDIYVNQVKIYEIQHSVAFHTIWLLDGFGDVTTFNNDLTTSCHSRRKLT